MTAEGGKNEPDTTDGKQSRITRFLPATKAPSAGRKQSSTPVGKRTRAGLAGIGSPDQPGIESPNQPGPSPRTDTTKGSAGAESPPKSPEQKRNRHLGSFVVDSQQPIAAVPAYQRFSHLLDANAGSADRLARPHLPLPSKYNLVLKLQQALDSALSIAAGRGQRAVWHRLVPALQSTTGRTLTMEHLHLLLAFAPAYKLEACRVVEGGRKVDSVYLDTDPGSTERERRDALFNAILGHVEKAHEAFLQSLNIVLPKGAQLRNWHPKFCLDDVADPPTLADKGKDGDENKGTTPIPAIIKEVIKASVAPPAEGAIPREGKAQDVPQERVEKKGLSLTERIRLKEHQADLEKMAGPSSSKGKAIAASLPNVIDALSLMFNYAKKSVMFLSAVQERLRQSTHCPLSAEELDERLDCLQQRFPEWITVNRTDAPFTVRINKAWSARALKERL